MLAPASAEMPDLESPARQTDAGRRDTMSLEVGDVYPLLWTVGLFRVI